MLEQENGDREVRLNVETVTDPDGTVREHIVDVGKRESHELQTEMAEQSVRAFKLFTALRTIHGTDENWDESELFNLAASIAAHKPDASQFELLTELLANAADLGGLGASLRAFLGA